jgi:hypothetical protein
MVNHCRRVDLCPDTKKHLKSCERVEAAYDKKQKKEQRKKLASKRTACSFKKLTPETLLLEPRAEADMIATLSKPLPWQFLCPLFTREMWSRLLDGSNFGYSNNAFVLWIINDMGFSTTDNSKYGVLSIPEFDIPFSSSQKEIVTYLTMHIRNIKWNTVIDFLLSVGKVSECMALVVSVHQRYTFIKKEVRTSAELGKKIMALLDQRHVEAYLDIETTSSNTRGMIVSKTAELGYFYMDNHLLAYAVQASYSRYLTVEPPWEGQLFTGKIIGVAPGVISCKTAVTVPITIINHPAGNVVKYAISSQYAGCAINTVPSYGKKWVLVFDKKLPKIMKCLKFLFPSDIAKLVLQYTQKR